MLMTDITITQKYQKKLFLLHREEKLNSMPESKYQIYWDNRAS